MLADAIVTSYRNVSMEQMENQSGVDRTVKLCLKHAYKIKNYELFRKFPNFR